jgi:ribosomal protein S18 acetylase RimI-like enzyme
MTEQPDPWAGLPDRTALVDRDGRPVVIYSRASSTRDERPWADLAWRPSSTSVQEACAAVLEHLPGFALSTSDRSLRQALTDVGARVLRHAHTMSHALRHLPDGVAGSSVRVEPLSAGQLVRHARRLGELSCAAYPAGHPDHAHDSATDAAAELLDIAGGQLLGPYLDDSTVALVDGRIAGACLLVDRDGAPPDGGPWVIDVFRDPACRTPGVGASLLVAALRAVQSSGASALSLVVSHSNDRARALYGRLGFDDVTESWTVVVPDVAAPPLRS